MKRTMVLLLMVLVLAVGLALPSTALAAKAPTIPIQVTISATPTTIHLGQPVQLHVVVHNTSSVALNNFGVGIPQLWFPWLDVRNAYRDINNDYVLDPGETWIFDQTIDGSNSYNSPCPTKSTRYTVNLVGSYKVYYANSLDYSIVNYYISNAAQVKVIVTR
jgi:hypothetical protein